MKVRAKLAIRHTIGDGADVVRDEVLELDEDDIDVTTEAMCYSREGAIAFHVREHMMQYVEVSHALVEG